MSESMSELICKEESQEDRHDNPEFSLFLPKFDMEIGGRSYGTYACDSY